MSAIVINIFLRQELFLYISPILQTLLHRKMSHNITIDTSGRVFSPVSERMLQLIETNCSLADKRMLWKFNDVSAYTVLREYSKHDHRLCEAYLDNCHAQEALSRVSVVAPPYRWYCTTQRPHREKYTNILSSCFTTTTSIKIKFENRSTDYFSTQLNYDRVNLFNRLCTR